MNKLERIFAEQADFNKSLGIDTSPTSEMDERERAYWLVKYLTALFVETGEAFNKTDFKWWKKPPKPLPWDSIKEELIDALHFLVSAMQVAGMSADEVFENYLRKNRANHQRQKNGYE